jgi:hypothetical protein
MSHAELYWVFLLVSCSGAMKGTVPTWAEIGGDQRRPGGVRRPARVHLLRHLLLALVHDGREAEVDQLQLRLVAQRLEGEVLELNVAVAHLSRAQQSRGGGHGGRVLARGSGGGTHRVVVAVEDGAVHGAHVLGGQRLGIRLWVALHQPVAQIAAREHLHDHVQLLLLAAFAT